MLPKLGKSNDQIDMINAFLGINRNYNISNAEFEDTYNMTNDYYPTIGNRIKRGIIGKLKNPQCMIGGKYISYVDDNKLYYNDALVANLSATNNKRQLVMMGAYLCCFPDGLIYNTYTEEISYINNSATSTDTVTLTLTKLDGTVFDTITSSTEPSDKSKYWIDTSMPDSVVLKIYSTTTSMWVAVGTTYVKIVSTGIGKGFKAYDAVDISGIDASANIYNGQNFNTTNLIYDAGDDYIVIAGLINHQFVNTKAVTLKRQMPDMDFVCELDNRIWGCSSANHEIYACKLGDPTNWHCYAGLDSDSYAATIGTEDVFTGAIAYSGYVFFFKEQGYHKIYGSKPSNFEVIWKPCRGVQNGSEKTLSVINEVLIYKARDAVCLFDGSVTKISDKIDSTTYYDAVAGAYRDKYYISMRDSDYNYYLFVYDTSKGTWIREDNLELKYAVNGNGGLYLVDRDFNVFVVNNEKIYFKKYPSNSLYPNKELYAGNSEAGDVEDDIEWSITSGDLGEESPFHKYVKRLDIKVWLDISAYMKVEIMYDSSELWLTIMEFFSTKKKTLDIPMAIQRCDHFKIRISGKGNVKIYSISKITEKGSDRNGGD